MFKYLIIIVLSIAALGCKTTLEKRINKDITGINEQLYDLEKEQIKNRLQIQDFKKKILQLAKKSREEDKTGELDQIYKTGYKNYLEQNYSEAINSLAKLTAKFSDNPLADNALYWQAESYYKLNNTEKALSYYQLVYRYFPFSNKADYSLYKIGMIYFNQKDSTKALLAFNRLVREYPGSDLFKAASIKIRQIKKKRRRK
ncbi:MAG: tetratricopeptide repeat protein [bacterium]|nr:tetratricopeptide repeat protein [bacterium]